MGDPSVTSGQCRSKYWQDSPLDGQKLSIFTKEESERRVIDCAVEFVGSGGQESAWPAYLKFSTQLLKKCNSVVSECAMICTRELLKTY